MSRSFVFKMVLAGVVGVAVYSYLDGLGRLGGAW
jgi:hypothetical protein